METKFLQKTKYSLLNYTTPLSSPPTFLAFNRKTVNFEQTLFSTLLGYQNWTFHKYLEKVD